MSTPSMPPRRGALWFAALTGQQGLITGAPATVRVADAPLGDCTAHFIAVVPDAGNRFPRACRGEVGLEEAWTLAYRVTKMICDDSGNISLPIVAIVDVSSQAYGQLEELLGLHQACAAAAEAYVAARLAGHPVIAFLVGKAMSGAFLAHGYQANRILALDDSEVLIQAMSKSAAARIMRRSLQELDAAIDRCPPMAYDIRTFEQWGLLHEIISGVDADAPGRAGIARVRAALKLAVADARRSPHDLRCRLQSSAVRRGRIATNHVRTVLANQWDLQ